MVKPIRLPKGYATRYYQTKGVLHLMRNQRALLLDDVGLGKTAQALVALNSLGAKRTLILCPPAVRYHWEAETLKWTDRGYKIHVMTKELEYIPEDADVIVVSYSLLNSPMIVDQLKAIRWSVGIFDELHYLKSTKAKRSKVVLGRGGVITKCVYAWGLTATPMNNAPIDLWPVFRSMGKEHLPKKCQDWMGYTRYFCARYKSNFGWDVSGCMNLPVLNQALFDSGFALRRTKEEVLTELPQKTFRMIPMASEKEGKAEIKWGQKLRRKGVRLNIDAAELAEARKALGEEKLDATLEFIKSIDEPVVIFGWHREFLEKVASKTKGALYYGSMSPKAKEKSKQRFLDGDTNYFVANIQSAGTGLDGLQHRASRCIFAEFPWTYSEIDQASGRLHRMGQKNPVLADLLCIHGGVEEYILQTILRKEKFFGDLVDKQGSQFTM